MKSIRALNAFGRTIVSAFKSRKYLRRIIRLHRRSQDRIVSAGETQIWVDCRQRAPRPPPVVVDCFLNPLCRIITRPIFTHSDLRAGDASDFFGYENAGSQS